MKIRGILFDKDGTLIDFNETFDAATGLVLDELTMGDKELLKQAAEAVGYDLEKKQVLSHSVIIAGTGIDIAHALGTVLPVENPEEFGMGIDQMYGEICLNTVTPIKGAERALDQLYGEGMLMGVATNDIEQNAVSQIEIIELDHLFETILGSDSGYGPKPGTGMLDAFASLHGLQSYEVMVVGDTTHDLEAAIAAGMVAVGVETGLTSRDELEAHADFMIRSVAELPALITENSSDRTF